MLLSIVNDYKKKAIMIIEKVKVSRLLINSLLCIILNLFTINLYSQTVTTFISGSDLNGPDGFAFDKEGNLFVANWGNGAGSTIF